MKLLQFHSYIPLGYSFIAIVVVSTSKLFNLFSKTCSSPPSQRDGIQWLLRDPSINP